MQKQKQKTKVKKNKSVKRNNFQEKKRETGKKD